MEDVNNPVAGDGALPVTEEMITRYPCPFLGAFRDQKSVMSYASGNNRCYALEDALEIAREKQKTHCLSENYTNCYLYQQALAKQTDLNNKSKNGGFLNRMFQARSLALAMMLLLILLAALAWWPFPGLIVGESAVLGASLIQNSQKKPASEQETGEDGVAQSPSTEEGVSQSVIAQAPEYATAEPTKAKPTAVPGPAISDLPDLYQLFQIRREEDADDTYGSFNPIAYSDKGVNLPSLPSVAADDILRIYLMLPDEEQGQSINIARQEQVNILGRDDAGEWLRVRTESGLEGWIRAEDTAVGKWVNTLAVFEKFDGSDEALSVPTKLPVVADTAIVEGDLAVHTAPKSRFKIISHIDKGEIVSLLGRWQEGPWVRIRLDDGTEGWVDSDGLAMDEN
jgi:hypothetical protein